MCTPVCVYAYVCLCKRVRVYACVCVSVCVLDRNYVCQIRLTQHTIQHNQDVWL